MRQGKKEKNITATKNPTNLPTVRLKIWQFLRAGRVTRNEDIQFGELRRFAALLHSAIFHVVKFHSADIFRSFTAVIFRIQR